MLLLLKNLVADAMAGSWQNPAKKQAFSEKLIRNAKGQNLQPWNKSIFVMLVTVILSSSLVGIMSN